MNINPLWIVLGILGLATLATWDENHPRTAGAVHPQWSSDAAYRRDMYFYRCSENSELKGC